MDLCSACDDFVRLLPGCQQFFKYQLQAPTTNLQSGTPDCRLCGLIHSLLPNGRLKDPITVFAKRDFQGSLSSLTIRINYLRQHPYKGNASQNDACVDDSDEEDDIYINHIYLAIYAEEGSPAAISNDISTALPLYNDDSLATSEMIQSWLGKCLHEHDDCQADISTKIVDDISGLNLLKRVLDIGTTSTPYIKLIQPTGMQGHYCTLSHCWGLPDKQPLCTTKKTLKDHFTSIKFEKLPKTFQDAVTITRRIGVRYLWIDSLCILQDDKEEWKKESEKLGVIYGNSLLTFAAAGAEDSSKGCFVSERLESHSVKVPYYSKSNADAGSFWISALTKSEISPIFGPLRKRAWAFLERKLSRRTLYFMQGGITWKCKKMEINERGTPMDIADYSGWDDMIHDYSGSQLTYETDRLIALQGLVNELQKTRHEQYHLGMWTGNLLKQLLWMISLERTECMKGLPEMPSWTWVSKPGLKVFWKKNETTQDISELSANCRFHDSNSILLEGGLKPCMVTQKNIDSSCFPAGDYSWSPELLMDVQRQGSCRFISHPNNDSKIFLGLAAMDDETEALHDLYCLFVMSQRRKTEDPLYYISIEQESFPLSGGREVSSIGDGKSGLEEKQMLKANGGDFNEACRVTAVNY